MVGLGPIKSLRTLAFTTLAALSLLFSIGCSVHGQITDLINAPRASLAQQVGLISGSTQSQHVSGYIVSSSVGALGGGIQQTTAQGYKVYTSVQGSTSSQ